MAVVGIEDFNFQAVNLVDLNRAKHRLWARGVEPKWLETPPGTDFGIPGITRLLDLEIVDGPRLAVSGERPHGQLEVVGRVREYF